MKTRTIPTRTILATLLLLGLAACGKRDALRPPQGHNLPPKPGTASAQPTVDQLLTPPVETRPGRIAAEGLGVDLCDVLVLAQTDDSAETALLRRIVRKTGLVIQPSADPNDTATAVLHALKPRP